MTNPPYPEQPSYSPRPGPGPGAGPGRPGDYGGPPHQEQPRHPEQPPYDVPAQRTPGSAPDATGLSGAPHHHHARSPASADIGGSGSPQSGYSGKSFVGVLFDLSFDHMITIRLIRLSYVLVLAFTGVTALAMLLLAWSFSEWNGAIAVVTLLATPIVVLFQIVTTRMFLEFLINQFKITEELRKIRETTER